jgi:hypothetical protein
VGVRNLVTGTYRVRQTRVEWTPVVDGVIGEGTPGKGPGPRGHPAGRVGNTLEGSKTAGEDSRVVASRTAGRVEGKPQGRASRAKTPAKSGRRRGARSTDTALHRLSDKTLKWYATP